ncbi:hypothetical protein LY78DRAFT_677864 [Colletotrichum sublineola]|nr:hypothetical protein LY78DRAFT_677864 [Colletotrichum sublineola]
MDTRGCRFKVVRINRFLAGQPVKPEQPDGTASGDTAEKDCSVWGAAAMSFEPSVQNNRSNLFKYVQIVQISHFNYAHEKRPANVRGHNDPEVRDWFPSQLSALFDGAHGHSNAGIYYQGEEGVFSVIVAGAYKDLDVDSGASILYSGSNARESNDKDNILPSTEAIKVLFQPKSQWYKASLGLVIEISTI